MATAHVIYHFDQPGWWAESPEYPEYSAFGDSLDEVRALAQEGLCFLTEDDTLQVVDLLPPVSTPTYAYVAEGLHAAISGVPKFATSWRDLSTTGVNDPVLA